MEVGAELVDVVTTAVVADVVAVGAVVVAVEVVGMGALVEVVEVCVVAPIIVTTTLGRFRGLTVDGCTATSGEAGLTSTWLGSTC